MFAFTVWSTVRDWVRRFVPQRPCFSKALYFFIFRTFVFLLFKTSLFLKSRSHQTTHTALLPSHPKQEGDRETESTEHRGEQKTDDGQRRTRSAKPREFPSRRRTSRRGDSRLTNGGGHLHNLATLLPSRPRDSFRSRKNLHVRNQPVSFPPFPEGIRKPSITAPQRPS